MSRTATAVRDYVTSVDGADARDVAKAFRAGAEYGANHAPHPENPMLDLILPAHCYLADRKGIATAEETVDIVLAFAAGAMWSVAERQAAAAKAAGEGIELHIRHDRTFVAAGREYRIVSHSAGAPRVRSYRIVDLETLRGEGGFRLVGYVRRHVEQCVRNAWPVVGERPA